MVQKWISKKNSILIAQELDHLWLNSNLSDFMKESGPLNIQITF